MSEKAEKPLGLYIKFSKREPMDVQLWALLEADKASREVNISSAIKILLWEWYRQRQTTGSIAALAPGTSPGGAHRSEFALPAPRDSEDPSDEAVQRVIGFNFDEF